MGVAGLLLHPGTVACLCVGNVSLLLLLLVALGWRAWRRGRSGGAGGWLGLAAGMKLYPGLLVLGLAGARAWREVGVAAAVVLGCWVAAAAVVGSSDVRTYARERAPANAGAYVGHGFNLSAAGAAHRAFGEPNPHTPWLERVAVRPTAAAALAWGARAAVGLLVLAALLRARGRPDFPDRAVAALVPGMLLLSPLTWLHAVPMMVIPLAVLWLKSGRPRRTALLGCALLMCVDDHGLAVRWVAAAGAVPPAGNVVLLAPMWGMLGALTLAASAPRAARG